MKIPYVEGTWFGVPLRKSGFAVGVVTRVAAKRKVILCYFFGPRRASIPTLSDVQELSPKSAVLAIRVGDLFIIEGKWPIIGKLTPWIPTEWPTPLFIRRDELSHKAWQVQYSDRDPTIIECEKPEPYESTLEADGLFGAGAAEIVLTKMLA